MRTMNGTNHNCSDIHSTIVDKQRKCARVINIVDISSNHSPKFYAINVRPASASFSQLISRCVIHFFSINFKLTNYSAVMTKLKIVVIGAGLSGLCSAKYAIQAGHSVTVYEQTSSVGGTWIYTEETGTDEYGLDIHTSMYHGLR